MFSLKSCASTLLVGWALPYFHYAAVTNTVTKRGRNGLFHLTLAEARARCQGWKWGWTASYSRKHDLQTWICSQGTKSRNHGGVLIDGLLTCSHLASLLVQLKGTCLGIRPAHGGLSHPVSINSHHNPSQTHSHMNQMRQVLNCYSLFRGL